LNKGWWVQQVADLSSVIYRFYIFSRTNEERDKGNGHIIPSRISKHKLKKMEGLAY